MIVNEAKKLLIAADEVPAPCWNELGETYQLYFARDGYEAFQMLSEHRFHIAFLDIFLFGYDGLYLLRYIQENGLCDNVILTSETPSFQYAREGILHGAADYLLRPFTMETVRPALDRLEARTPAPEDEPISRITQSICDVLGTSQFDQRLRQGLDELARRSSESFQMDRSFRELYQNIVTYAFERYEWLSLYLSHKDCDTIRRLNTSDPNLVQEYCESHAVWLNQLIGQLHPDWNSPKMEPILEYMLLHVDEVLSQKELAAKFFISSSTLSTYFSNTPLRSYRQYNQELRMTRAEFLLRNTDMKLYEICEQLGFRDVNYFSQLFKKRTGVSVTDYRSTDSGNYEI